MMKQKKTDATTAEAKSLRKKQTGAERQLWLRLKARQFQNLKFRRQQPIGPYIVDFICFERNLVIEIDGGQHNFESRVKSDEERTKELERRGYKVIRFWNNDITGNLEGVIEQLAEFVK